MLNKDLLADVILFALIAAVCIVPLAFMLFF